MHPDVPSLGLELFGAPQLLRGGVPVRGRAAYRRRLALLAILAAARGKPVARERLMGLLWPEHSAEAARHTLSESLYVLRKELGEGVLSTVGAEVALETGRMTCDLERFLCALEEGWREAAAALYRAPFLDGFYVEGAPEFERWVEGERESASRAFARAVESLAEEAEAGGDPRSAAEWWRRLAAHDPYSGRVALRLAEALHRGGEGAAALRHLEGHAAFLREALGVGLHPEAAALIERLREGMVPLPPRPPSPAPAAEPSPHPATPAGPPPGPGASPPLAPPPVIPAVSRSAASIQRRRWATGVVLGVALAAAALAVVAVLRSGGAPGVFRPPLDPSRIAVLYFDDYSEGESLRYLAGGLTESLIHELSQVEALDVVSRTGVKPYRGAAVPLDSVAARLRVGSVVEGSVQRFGDSVRVTVQLIDAASQSHLESRVLVRSVDALLALQGEVAEEVAGALRRRLGQEVRLRQTAGEAGSAAALEAVLRAEQLRADAGTVARSPDFRDGASALDLLARADSFLVRAEAAAPGWSRPTLLRGWVALQAGELAGGPAGSGRAAVSFAERALAREPGSAAALELRGWGRWRSALTGEAESAPALAAAEADLRAALDRDPGRASAWGTLSQVVLARGRFEEAEVAARRALERDAWLEGADVLLRRLYFAALGRADHPAARASCERGARMFPDDWHFVECRLTLLREDASRPPDPAEAWRLVALLDRLDPPAAARAAGRGYAPVYRRMVAAAVSARAGDADSARSVLARARDAVTGDGERVSLAFDEAYLRVLLGDREGARARLAEYLAARPAVAGYLERDPVLGGLVTPPTPVRPPPPR